ncbi:hypothetical protein AC630_08645 [Bradyrhizobium sp. AS23.2]|nr:hypothetical protein AC630_08645 [Bradyrhizobium sp. AS23.2]
MRSWLFVPGDSERKLAKCLSCSADAIIIDLEDSVTAENKLNARATAASAIRRARESGVSSAIVIRTNALQTGLIEDDIAGTIKAAPDGYVVPKITAASDLQKVASMLSGVESGARTTSLIPIATEMPEAVFRLPEIAGAHERVRGIFWGMEDLGTELGSRRTRRPDGEILEVFKTVRSLALFAAASAGIACVDTPFVDISNSEGLIKEAIEASWMGFSGKLAIHPSQVDEINSAFSPTIEEIEEARCILQMSQDGGGAAFRYNGRMIDTPHLAAAKRLLARASHRGSA